jgi:hypothetical protein
LHVEALPVMRSPTLLGRPLSLAALLCATLGACTITTAPERPAGAVPLAPPAVYARWWAMTEACSGVTGPLAAVSFWQVPGVSSFDRDGKSVLGYWTTAGNQIVLAGKAALDGGNVRHEMLHALVRVGGHPRDQFLGKCAGVVDCGTDCIADAGPPPPADPAAPLVSPRQFEISVAVVPERPSRAVDDGQFSVTVSVRNPQQRSVVARLGTTNIQAWSFQFELVGENGAGIVGNEIVLDASTVTFAAGETKRQVFDFSIGSSFAPRRVPPGAYTVRGAYGVQFTLPVALTVGP